MLFGGMYMIFVREVGGKRLTHWGGCSWRLWSGRLDPVILALATETSGLLV